MHINKHCNSLVCEQMMISVHRDDVDELKWHESTLRVNKLVRIQTNMRLIHMANTVVLVDSIVIVVCASAVDHTETSQRAVWICVVWLDKAKVYKCYVITRAQTHLLANKHTHTYTHWLRQQHDQYRTKCHGCMICVLLYVHNKQQCGSLVVAGRWWERYIAHLALPMLRCSSVAYAHTERELYMIAVKGWVNACMYACTLIPDKDYV